jgi:hypothetical protein
MTTPIFSIYAVDYDNGLVIQFSHTHQSDSFFSAMKTAVEMSEGLCREFVVVSELTDGTNRFSKTNPKRVLQFNEICLKNCYHVKEGRFHFKKFMIASPVLFQHLFMNSGAPQATSIPSILFPGVMLCA